MSNLFKIEATTAAEVCARFLLSPNARALLRDGMPPGLFIEAMVGNKQYIAGIDFLAYALPPREAVWWGCLCFQHACVNQMSALDKAAVTAAVQWVLQPGDNTRGAAKVHAETVQLLSRGLWRWLCIRPAPEFLRTAGERRRRLLLPQRRQSPMQSSSLAPRAILPGLLKRKEASWDSESESPKDVLCNRLGCRNVMREEE